MQQPAPPQDSPPGNTDASTPPRPHSRWRKKLLFTFLKITIAVVGIWWVMRGVTWSDTAELPAGMVLRTLAFVDDTPVAVADQRSLDGRHLVRIRFPATPVQLSATLPSGEVRRFQAVIGGDVAIPGTDQHVPLAQETELNLSDLKDGRIHQGLKSLLIQAGGKWHLLAGAWLLLGIPFLITAIRWRNLMRPQGIDMPLGKCLQLTFVGQFYSIILPGITGGDLVKIVYAASLTGSKTKSFITILLDRVIGLVALMVIAGTSAGVQLLLNSRHAAAAPGPAPALEAHNTLLNVFLLIVVLLAIMTAGTVVYFSHRLRRLLGITWFIENFGSLAQPTEGVVRAEHAQLEHLFRVLNGLVLAAAVLGAGALATLRWGTNSAWAQHNTLAVVAGLCVMAAVALLAILALALHRRLVNRVTPLMGKIVHMIIGVDETLHVYRGHLGLLAWAFVISLISQLTLPLSAWLSGLAFGMNAPPTYYMAYVPLAILAASLPISLPQGAGFLEFVLNLFFVKRGTATVSQAFALTQSVRFLPIIWNLLGAYWVVTGKYSRPQVLNPSPTTIVGGSSPATIR